MNFVGLVTLLVKVGSDLVEIGKAAAPTVKAITEMMDAPPDRVDGETPVKTPEIVQAEIVAAVDKAKAPFQNVAATADAELEALRQKREAEAGGGGTE